VNAKGTIQKKDGKQVVELVPVRLEVKLVDVWAVSEFIQGHVIRELLRARDEIVGVSAPDTGASGISGELRLLLERIA
jgi:hypothetical protein